MTTEARERLADAVAAMTETANFTAWLKMRATMHDYSLNNLMLIASQRPDAEQVAGYRAWQALGRQVRKGEHGIRILAPCLVKQDKNAPAGESFALVGFRCVSVFDISQTDGEPLPTLEYASLDGDAPDLADHLVSVALAAGLEIRREPIPDPDVHGYLTRSDRAIVVNTNVTSGAMAAKVVAHELGHFFDPALVETPAAYRAHRGDCEAVAESVAYVVCAAYGIDAGPAAVGYVASWTDGNADRVRDLAGRIDTAAAAILPRKTRTKVDA